MIRSPSNNSQDQKKPGERDLIECCTNFLVSNRDRVHKSLQQLFISSFRSIIMFTFICLFNIETYSLERNLKQKQKKGVLNSECNGNKNRTEYPLLTR